MQIFLHDDGEVYTSLTARHIPQVVPYLGPWDPKEDHDWCPRDIKSQLAPLWAFSTHPWLPVVVLNPTFQGPIFECLNHSRYSIDIEPDGRGRFMLHREIRQKWHDLEEKMMWCLTSLLRGWFVPLSTVLPQPPSKYSYQDSQVDAKYAAKLAIRSCDAFVCKSTVT